MVIPASGAGSPSLTITYIKQLRLGIDDLYGYTSYDYGGGTVGVVNTATGNLVLQHGATAIGAPGFTVDLTHTFNGQDPYGQKKTNLDSWAVFGEGWSFSQDLRLFEIQGGDATVFKDGTGRVRVFTQLDIVSGFRTHTAPIQYGYTLVKDVNVPVGDANKVWTLTATSGGERLFFDANGRLKRREDRNGNHLTYAYDRSDRLTTITDEISRTTTLAYSAPGSPNRLYRITDMAGRIFEYGYDAYGNLITVKDTVGTSAARTTTFGYAVADQLTNVTDPNGNQSVIDYGNLHGWEQSTTESWQMASGSTGTVVKSTDRAYTGSGSLKATLGSAGVPLNSEIVRPYSPNKSWNSAPQEMIAWIWLSSGARHQRHHARLEHLLVRIPDRDRGAHRERLERGPPRVRGPGPHVPAERARPALPDPGRPDLHDAHLRRPPAHARPDHRRARGIGLAHHLPGVELGSGEPPDHDRRARCRGHDAADHVPIHRGRSVGSHHRSLQRRHFDGVRQRPPDDQHHVSGVTDPDRHLHLPDGTDRGPYDHG